MYEIILNPTFHISVQGIIIIVFRIIVKFTLYQVWYMQDIIGKKKKSIESLIAYG